MLNLKIKLCFPALLLMISMAYAQKPNSASSNLKAKTEEINNAVNKKLYLQSFLKQVQINPAKYCNSSKELRDSVTTHMQLDLNALNLSVLKKQKDKKVKKIAVGIKKSFEISLQMILDGQLLADQQKELDGQIAKVNELIAEAGTF
ncbi:hypothetical protein [Mucilaginibacter paludis]|uniref:Outer membrane chaperone Skp (OmpH) n=1 Tax=Mucilaginibacter paludis DSM 18603 TaxID=714943 RepID=H1Y913_9SPHI|nr:hypothetical protein [Mucilaginibacter paludis]EHQ29051.1 hypothetical protein Mucpa_4970 [Mucilaginibacter paludis DSM 18603]